MDIEINRQQVIGWSVVPCACDEVSRKVVEPIVSLVGRTGDDRFDEEHSYFSNTFVGILPAAPGTYRITTFLGADFVVLGISHPGDGLSDEYWLALADETLRDKATMAAERVTHDNNQRGGSNAVLGVKEV